jgi:hypothetical protein
MVSIPLGAVMKDKQMYKNAMKDLSNKNPLRPEEAAVFISCLLKANFSNVEMITILNMALGYSSTMTSYALEREKNVNNSLTKSRIAKSTYDSLKDGEDDVDFIKACSKFINYCYEL